VGPAVRLLATVVIGGLVGATFLFALPTIYAWLYRKDATTDAKLPPASEAPPDPRVVVG